MKPAAFLFDLDGTLVDTEWTWACAIAAFVGARGGATTPEALLPHLIGRNWLDIDRWLHVQYPQIGPSEPLADAAALRPYYAQYAQNASSLVIASSVVFFQRASRVAPCAIVSGSPHEDVVAAARLCGLGSEVALVLGAGEYAAGKPSPSGYLLAAERLGVPPASCVVVEDSTVGVASGVAAGMRVIALNRRQDVPQDFTGATWQVEDLSQLDPENLA